MTTDELLTVPEVMTRLRKQYRFVISQLKRGNLRGAYYGGAWHIKSSDLDSFIESHMNVRPVEKRARRSA